jgi:hypothetical protein
MIARRPLLVVLVASCALCGGLALGVVQAGATESHEYRSQITEVPSVGPHGEPVALPGPLGQMESMTVDSGHLWIAEKNGGSRIDEFDASTGAFVSQLVPASLTLNNEGQGIAVGHATGEAELYVGGSVGGAPAVAVFNGAGTLQATWTGADVPGGSFGGATNDVAVDNSTNPLDEGRGDVYVAVPSQRVIDVFHPEAGGKEKYVTQLTGISPSEPFHIPTRMAVNEANGDVIVLDPGASAVDVFEPTALGYAFVRKILGPPPSGVFSRTFNLAVDGGGGESNGEIYVTEGFGPVAINQFSSTGAYLGHITGVGSPGGNLEDVYSLAVDPASHDVYIADNRKANGSSQPSVVDIFGPDVVIPDVTTGPASNLTAKSATLMGTVNPHKAGPVTCQFVWGTTTELGHTAPCSPPQVQEGGSAVAVEATLSQATQSELESHTNYCYRLQASNAKGTNPGEVWQDQCFTTPGPGSEAVSAVTAESVTFGARINPHNAPTTYYVQYGTTSAYGTSVPAPPGALVGSGEGDVEVTYHVQGLQAGTVYHYRVVALSELGGKVEEFDGPDRTFTTQRSGGAVALSDGRQYEMVTPPQKQGALFFGQNYGWLHGTSPSGFVAEASAGGDAMIDLASQPTEAEPQGYSNEVSVLSTRGPAGWSSQVIAPPHEEGTGPALDGGSEYRFFSEDLSRGIVLPFGNFTPLSPEATEATPYLRTDYSNENVDEHCQTSCYRPLVTAANTREGAAFGGETSGKCGIYAGCGPKFVDATPDATHVVLESSVQLTSTKMEQAEAYLYEWSAGELQPLYLLPRSEGGFGVSGGELSSVAHQLSDNGSVFFTHDGHLYLHDVSKGESVRLDVAQGVQEPSEGAATFLYASSDGSRVLFSDSERLTSSPGGGIYECRIVEAADGVKCELGLTGLSGGSLIGGSHDASYLYFKGSGEKLFVDHFSGREWTTTDGPFIGRQPIGPDGAGEMRLIYRVSPNGLFLTLMSNEDLVGYNTRDAISGQPDQEVYLYDASSNRLVCASCNPTGARPVGVEYNNQFMLMGGSLLANIGEWVASNLPPWTKAGYFADAVYQPRFLSDSGRLFFDSNDALVPQDVNGTQDVYEYEPAGVGSCNTSSATYGERSGGCVSLISSGSSPEESAFMDASETGGDVFFITLAKLVSQDFDSALDVYDARECTAATPCYPAAAVSPPECSTGDSCKPAPTLQPSIFGPAPSATFSGAGNVVPSGLVPVVRPRSLTRAQKLAQGLRACRKQGRKKRAVCEREARKRYGPVGKPGRASAKHGKRG